MKTTAVAAAFAALLGFAGLTAASSAMAQPVNSADHARRIAMAQGMVTIEDIDQEDGIWTVEGQDSGGYDLDIDIDGPTGRILAIKADASAPKRSIGATVTLMRR